MSKQNINDLYKETSDLLIKLYENATKKGFHIDADLESGLFLLLLDEDYNEMILLKYRIDTAIKKIKDGTFRQGESDKIEVAA
jgi:hypothetical protein